MSINDFTFNPVNGEFTNQLPMKSVEKLSYLFSIEDCYRYKGDEALGAYYPVRIAPSMSIDMDAEWPVIMPAGTVVSILSLKDAEQYLTDDAEAGIHTSGLVDVSISAIDGSTLQKNINYMYDKEVSGFITICNGGSSANDAYVDNDGKYGIIDFNGDVATSGSPNYTRSANVPIGIVDSRIPADLRLRYLNYDALNSVTLSNHIALGGVLTIPYVIVYDTNAGDRTTVIAAIAGAVNSLHQYLYTDMNTAVKATAEASVKSGLPFKSNSMGKLTTWTSGPDPEEQRFAKVLELRNRVPYNLDEIIDTFPSSGMKGMDTGGLTARLFHFIKSTITASGIATAGITGTIAQVKDALANGFTTNTGTVELVFGQADVAFGTLR